MERVIISVIGMDKIGITAKVTTALAECNVNILDINQTILQDFFTMVTLCDISKANLPFAEFQERMTKIGEDLEMEIRVQKEEIFTYMHRI